MSDLKQIGNHPNYDTVATEASKSAVFIFIATFAYLVFFSGVSPGFVGGATFFVVGIFAASMLIGFPLFLLKLKFPNVRIIFGFLQLLLIVVLSQITYFWLFSKPTAEVAVQGREFKCEQPIPEFTLGRYSNPSEDELANLCECISNSLGEDNLVVSNAIVEGREGEVTQEEIQSFAEGFGKALQECGGMEM